MSETRGMFDVRCDDCGRMLGWSGLYRQRPACRCGYRPDQATIDAEQVRLDENRRLMDAPCGEFDAAGLRRKRQLVGLTLGQAAADAGLTRLTIRSFEEGTSWPTPEEAERLTRAYGGDAPEGGAA